MAISKHGEEEAGVRGLHDSGDGELRPRRAKRKPPRAGSKHGGACSNKVCLDLPEHGGDALEGAGCGVGPDGAGAPNVAGGAGGSSAPIFSPHKYRVRGAGTLLAKPGISVQVDTSMVRDDLVPKNYWAYRASRRRPQNGGRSVLKWHMGHYCYQLNFRVPNDLVDKKRLVVAMRTAYSKNRTLRSDFNAWLLAWCEKYFAVALDRTKVRGKIGSVGGSK